MAAPRRRTAPRKTRPDRSPRERDTTATSKWDFSFRPVSYWRGETRRFANVKGAERRRAIAEALGTSSIHEIPQHLLQETISKELFTVVGRIHPRFMGGETLPGYRTGEVEIARVTLASTLQDVSSVRARPAGSDIAYRVVDDNGGRYSCSPRRSKRPLTFGELVNLIDGCKPFRADWRGLVLGYAQQQIDGGYTPSDLEGFFEVQSFFYPDLGRYYDDRLATFLATELAAMPDRLASRNADEERDLEQLREGASRGDAESIMRLGYRHFFGIRVARNQGEAAKLWEASATLGNRRAKLNLAVCLRDAYGVPKDERRALELYEQLATEGYYIGLKEAAYCRWLGIGCEPDRFRALHWLFELAKKEGPDRYTDDLVKCLLCAEQDSDLDVQARAWIEGNAAAHTAATNMLQTLRENAPGRLPLRHAAGVGWLAEDPL